MLSSPYKECYISSSCCWYIVLSRREMPFIVRYCSSRSFFIILTISISFNVYCLCDFSIRLGIRNLLNFLSQYRKVVLLTPVSLDTCPIVSIPSSILIFGSGIRLLLFRFGEVKGCPFLKDCSVGHMVAPLKIFHLGRYREPMSVSEQKRWRRPSGEAPEGRPHCIREKSKNLYV